MSLRHIDLFFDIMMEKCAALEIYPGDGNILSRTFIKVCSSFSKPWGYIRKHGDNPSRGTVQYYDGIK